MEQEALDHAIRCWHAEETNAERIAQRKTLIVGIPAGFLAIVGFHADGVATLVRVVLGTAHAQPSTPLVGSVSHVSLGWSIVCLTSLALGMIGLLLSSAFAIGARRRDPEQAELASKELHPLRARQLTEWTQASGSKVRELCFTRTITAARTLHNLNGEVERRLFYATSWCLGGACMCASSFLIYPLAIP